MCAVWEVLNTGIRRELPFVGWQKGSQKETVGSQYSDRYPIVPFLVAREVPDISLETWRLDRSAYFIASWGYNE